jgi:hypothetical protein
MGNPGKVVLTNELKVKMGWFAALPTDVRSAPAAAKNVNHGRAE